MVSITITIIIIMLVHSCEFPCRPRGLLVLRGPPHGGPRHLGPVLRGRPPPQVRAPPPVRRPRRPPAAPVPLRDRQRLARPCGDGAVRSSGRLVRRHLTPDSARAGCELLLYFRFLHLKENFHNASAITVRRACTPLSASFAPFLPPPSLPSFAPYPPSSPLPGPSSLLSFLPSFFLPPFFKLFLLPPSILESSTFPARPPFPALLRLHSLLFSAIPAHPSPALQATSLPPSPRVPPRPSHQNLGTPQPSGLAG
jgi:hypothetical protein